MPRVHLVCLSLIAAACALPGVGQAQDAGVPTIGDIVAVCRQRQEAVTSGRFEWSVDQWMKKGAKGRPVHLGASAPPNPPEDMQFKTERTLLFSAANMRYESFGPQWNTAKKSYTPFRLTTTWNGTKCYTFQDPEGFWNGSINSDPFFQYLAEFEPLGWTYRMLDARWARLTIQEFSVRADVEEAGGEPCVVLELSKSGSTTPDEPRTKRLWLSRDRQYVVRRYEIGRGLRVLRRMDIEYANSPEGIPVPIRWTKVDGDLSNPSIVTQCDVSHFEFNIATAAESFQLEFPANTWVGEEGVERPYIVRKDGSHRTITEAELKRGAKYEDLLATPSGQAKLVLLKESSSVRWFWTIQGVLAAAILLLLYRARRAHSGG